MFEDALCATQQNGFDSDGGHDLALRLGGYFNRPEEERAAARAAIEDSFTVRSAQVSSRDAAVGKQFSRFRPSPQQVELFVVERPVWLSLLAGCPSIDDNVVAELAAELSVYRDALCFLDELSTRHLDEVSVVQPLVALWLEHVAEALFGEDALVSVRAEVEELTVKLPHSVVEISGDADRVVVVDGILGCVVEVKRPFDVFVLRGSAAKDQLLIEVAGFADVNGRDVFTGMVTDLFRLNIALRNRSQETADGRWVVYECRRRFSDPDEFTRAVLVVLAVGFRELFPALDLGRIWASPVAETARARRLAKREACRAEDLQRECDDKEDGGDSDDDLPPPSGAGAEDAQKRVAHGKAIAAAAAPASGPSGSKVKKRADGSPQQENAVSPPTVQGVKYQLVRARSWRTGTGTECLATSELSFFCCVYLHNFRRQWKWRNRYDLHDDELLR